MARKSEIKEKFLEKYATCLNISSSAQHAGCSRNSIFKWTDQRADNKHYDKAFAQAMFDIDMSFVDVCEDRIRARVNKDDWIAIKYYLENRAPDRWKSREGGPNDSNPNRIDVVIHNTIDDNNNETK